MNGFNKKSQSLKQLRMAKYVERWENAFAGEGEASRDGRKS
jgi:hypothetical protein